MAHIAFAFQVQLHPCNSAGPQADGRPQGSSDWGNGSGGFDHAFFVWCLVRNDGMNGLLLRTRSHVNHWGELTHLRAVG